MLGLLSLLSSICAWIGELSSTFRSTSTVPGVAPGLNFGLICRSGKRFASVMSLCSEAMLIGCPSTSDGTCARAVSAEWCFASTTETLPSGVSCTTNCTIPCANVSLGWIGISTSTAS
ncbi:hypothetical protein D9M73_238190 [compost metagenome]